ncbi:MAG TPA: arylsulfatase [Verrucomicrobiales bacterium]|nr:arylsulfatase [Verrucomicrobiales bacterium]
MKKTSLSLVIAIVYFVVLSVGTARTDSPPNFIIIFTDDQGYGDLGCYGSPEIETPNIDRMAAEGMRFTSFYAAPFCGPSRASLMTGSYPPRLSLAFNHGPGAKTGIHADEITIAELLKSKGYRTQMIGKWHLGDHPSFLPHRNGFDDYLGLPYSNDMWPFHPKMPPRPGESDRMTAARNRAAYTGFAGQGSFYPPDGGFPEPLPLLHNDTVLETNPDQTRLTTRYTEKAVEFIGKYKDQPFFLYLAHAMPHVPLFVSEKFRGKSKRGLYGSVMMEIDWSVGEIMKKLKQEGIDEKTMVVFTSDNGPWLQYGIDGGSAGPLRGGKGSHWEGGMRVPGIFRWPGSIPAGSRTSAIAANMDLLPTLATLAGAALPSDRTLDGMDLSGLLESGRPSSKIEDRFFLYYGGSRRTGQPNLKAIRQGAWKLVLGRTEGSYKAIELYDLHRDISEAENRMDQYPEVTQRLLTTAIQYNADLAKEARPLGRLQL